MKLGLRELKKPGIIPVPMLLGIMPVLLMMLGLLLTLVLIFVLVVLLGPVLLVKMLI